MHESNINIDIFFMVAHSRRICICFIKFNVKRLSVSDDPLDGLTDTVNTETSLQFKKLLNHFFLVFKNILLSILSI